MLFYNVFASVNVMYLLTLVAIQLEFSSSAHVLICSLLLASNLLIVFFIRLSCEQNVHNVETKGISIMLIIIVIHPHRTYAIHSYHTQICTINLNLAFTRSFFG